MKVIATIGLLVSYDPSLVEAFIPHALTAPCASQLTNRQVLTDPDHLTTPENEYWAESTFKTAGIEILKASDTSESSPALTASDISKSDAVLTVNNIAEYGKKKGIFFKELDNSNQKKNEKMISVDGKKHVNFATCSYMGLESHPKVIKAVQDDVETYGSQLSVSRAFLSHPYYNDAEALLEEIFERPVLLSPSTTLGHFSALPVLIGDNDAIIIDQQVHNSVQTAAQLLKARGVPIVISRHNDMKHLEAKISKLATKHDKVWYLGDGVYSMYGDYANFEGLNSLLEKYKSLNVYLDDAHGVSWYGKHGKGIVDSMMGHHDRLVIAISLQKSFGAGGGAIVFPNEAQRSLIRHTGGPMLFSTPIPPPMLAALKASLKFHLSEEAKERQEKLSRLINETNALLREEGIPQCIENNSPIFFIPIGPPQPTIDVVNRVVADGFYVNPATYPATPERRGGLRFMMHCNVNESDLRALVSSIARHYRYCLRAHCITSEQISRDFKIPRFSI